MDRSFLTDAQIVDASREFICIRLATYEDKDEAEFLQTIFVGRDGELQNTVFAILSPDAKQFLCRTARSPNFAFRTPASMAAAMRKISLEFPGGREPRAYLPKMKNYRLALDVAACDGLPLIVAVVEESDQVVKMESQLAALAKDTNCGGRVQFVVTDIKDAGLSQLSGYDGEPAIYLVKPGKFGIDGEVIKRFMSQVPPTELRREVAAFADQSLPLTKQHRQHVWAGRQQGIDWKTEIPVTDRMSLRAQQRGE